MNFAIKKMLLAVPFSIAAIGLASPANAFGPSDRSASATEMAKVQPNGPSTPAAATKQVSAKKYCHTIEASTGSRLTYRDCKTRAEWDRLGYELSDKE